VQPLKKKRAFGDAIGMLDFADGGLKCFFALVVAYGIINQLSEHDYEFLAGALFLMAVAAILGILAIVGGICALRRKRWGWALAGAVGGVLPFFPLGIASTILTVMARDEFERQPESR
jgi:hypothetical protein